MMTCFSRLLVAAFLVSLSGAPLSKAKEPRVTEDRLAFELPDLQDNLISSADSLFLGKVVLITLWGTWCPPCISEIPTFVDLQERYAEQGLAILGIAFERDAEPTARKQRLRVFSEKHKINYTILDGGATNEFSDALPTVVDVKGLPIEIMIDRSGQVVACRNGYGYKKKWAENLEKEIQGLLKGKRNPDQ